MFNKIASDWARKRKKPWKPYVKMLNPLLNEWMNYYKNIDNPLSHSSLMFIDLGSGSGRNTPYFENYCNRLVELDQSREMLKNNPYSNVKIQAEMQQLPFRSDVFDGIFSIATLHHIKGIKKRNKAINEIIRIGKIGSLISITVWRFYQKKFIKEFKRQLNYCDCDNPKSDFEIGDVNVPWIISQKNGNITVNRFYHLFRTSEFRKLTSNFNKIRRCTMGKNIKKSKKKDNLFFVGTI